MTTVWQRLGAGLKAWFWNWLRDWRSHAISLLVIVAVVVGVSAWQARHVPAGPAPAFSAPLAGAPAGTQITLEQWRARHPGRAVALHIWAEWCPICRMEEGSITSLQSDWPVLTIAMRSGDAAKVARVLDQRELPWLTAVDADGSLSARYGLQAVPAFIVLDPQGNIRHAAVGYTTGIGMRLRLWLAQNF
ncbi:MAG: redoxin domain-containing protein [Hylemonella sp.]|nr:redoxin domain-containing protein [Hylemonella sp.]